MSARQEAAHHQSITHDGSRRPLSRSRSAKDAQSGLRPLSLTLVDSHWGHLVAEMQNCGDCGCDDSSSVVPTDGGLSTEPLKLAQGPDTVAGAGHEKKVKLVSASHNQGEHGVGVRVDSESFGAKCEEAGGSSFGALVALQTPTGEKLKAQGKKAGGPFNHDVHPRVLQRPAWAREVDRAVEHGLDWRPV
eukprot:CAMPEP_0118978144 /NCGR_PEP_ID=MMETSP1173-20130426/22987_1 /TAXON_ID=1034831 /ORGANISM="Rhizochromulina marina cf, Strain CCMP1243" /LENGTH=189 /DNA_ID=CAMNT_0006928323 /DNA_START=70 /DNA_END=640 /DNA_ORIENTATION=-